MKAYKILGRHPVMLIMTILTVMLLAIHHGFCLKSLKFISDKELIDNALQHTIDVIKLQSEDVIFDVELYENGKKLHRRVPGSSVSPYFYNNLNEFYEKNPGCCSVGKRASDGWRTTWFNRIRGNKNWFVHINYKIRLIGDDGEVRIGEVDEYTALSNCGRVSPTLMDY